MYFVCNSFLSFLKLLIIGVFINYKLIVFFGGFLLGACQPYQSNNSKEDKKSIARSCEENKIKTSRLFFMLQILYLYESKDIILDRKNSSVSRVKKIITQQLNL